MVQRARARLWQREGKPDRREPAVRGGDLAATTGLQADRAGNIALPFVLGAFALLAVVIGFVSDGVPWAFPLTAALIVATVFAGVALWRDPFAPQPSSIVGSQQRAARHVEPSRLGRLGHRRVGRALRQTLVIGGPAMMLGYA